MRCRHRFAPRSTRPTNAASPRVGNGPRANWHSTARCSHRKISDADERLIDAVAAATVRDATVLADLAIELAEWFVGEAVVRDTAAVQRGIAELVDQLDEPRAHTLHLHPDVVRLLHDADGTTPLGVGAIEPDPSLGPGELRLTTNGATVERIWSQAVERVREALAAELAATSGRDA